MKKTIIPLLAALVLSPGLLNAQTNLPARPPRPDDKPQVSGLAADTRFDLDFPGGDPHSLIEAIDHHLRNPINVIIQEQDKNVWIPPLKMNEVTVPELFSAVSQANSKQVTQITGTYFGGINGQASSQYQTATESYGFRTSANPITEHSIWYFYHVIPPKPPNAEPEQICRYFQLAPFLETYKIEDITTAIETGWRMLPRHEDQFGQAFQPQLSYHKDTKLLIAVGEPEKLKLIDSVLEQLRPNLKDTRGLPVPGRINPAPAKNGESDKP